MKRPAIVTVTVCVSLAMARPFAVQQTPRLTLQLEDYAALPITADNTNDNTRAQLARVNNMRDEPGGRRFFVNDLNGPLYILDKRTKTFTTYLDFNGAGGRPGLFSRFTFERNFATGLISFVFDPDYAHKRRVLHPPHGGSGDRRAGGTEEWRRRRSRPDRLHYDPADPDADRERTYRA